MGPLLPMVLLVLASVSAEAQIATGTYVGDGADPRPIAGLGFRPDIVIVKVDFSHATDTTCSSTVIRTSTMAGDASKLMHGIPLLAAPCPSPSTGLIPNLVQSLDADGFSVGNDDRVNGALLACGGANCTYHWVAFKANGNLRLGTYTGSGGGQSITGLAFSPEYVMVLPANNNKAQHRTPAGGVRSDRFDAGGAITTGITSLDADGFTVAAGGAPDNLSAAGVTYHYAAWNAVVGTTAVGTYTGDGVDNRPIEQPGFPPRYVIVQSNTDASGRDAIQRSASMAGDASINFRNAMNANRIQALRPLGFEVGTFAGVSNVGESYAFVAFGDGADNPCGTGGSWWDPAWGRRRRLVFNNSGQPEDLVDFPVLVKLDGSRIDYARTQNAGQDLRFVDSDNQTLLAHEIELWDEAGTSYVWVKVPRINASSASDFLYMYYDNAGAADGQNATGVWSNGYRGVWHLKENPAGAPPQFQDSTANNNDGTAQNSPVQAAGQIDGSLSFDGTSDRNINVPNSASLQLPTSLTVSGWARTTSADAQSRLVLARWGIVGTRNYWFGQFDATSFSFFVDSTETVAMSLSLINDGQWHHLVGVADAAAGLLRLYVDGIQRATAAYDGASQTGTSVLQIGNNPDSTGQNWNGGIDEVRVANVARSAAWIRTQHLSTSDGFLSFGSEVGACQLRSIGSAGPYTAGSVTATNGSWLVTGSGTAWTANNRGRGDRITIDGTNYTILTVTSDTTLRLASVFSGTSGSGKAYTIARKFTTLSAWENCVDGGAGTCAPYADNTASLVNDNRSEIGIAYEDSVFTLAADVIINGSVTDATHTITLTADGVNRHNGTPGAGVVVNANLGPNEIQVDDNDVTIEWLELVGLRGANAMGAIRVLSPAQNVLLQNLLIHDFLDATATFGMSGIRLSGAGGASLTVRNSMIWNGDQYGIEADEATDSLTVENCSIDNIPDNTDSLAAGIYASGTPNVLVRNTIVTRTGTRDYRINTGSFSPSSTNNVSEDLPGVGGAPGANAVTGVNPDAIFITPGANLHLEPGANAAVDSGVTLSFLTDIDGQLRPAGAWDRGADERDPTTAVELVSFEARPLDRALELAWQTASELRNLGFHLHRSASASGPYERLTSLLIPGLGSSPTGARYSYLDSGLANGTAYFYKLEDVDASSRSTFHGPVSAVPGPAAAPAPGDGGSESGSGPRGSGSGGALPYACPSWVLTAHGSLGSPGSPPPTCTRHGDPDAVSLELIARDARGATLELRTGGFWALRERSGGVRVFVPGFDFPQHPQAPALPFRRALIDAVVGRRVQLGGVRAMDQVGFPGLIPSALGKAEMQVSWDGTVRAGRRAVRAVAPQRASTDLVRLLPSVFQGEAKSAVVEISPLRFDARRRQLLLAKRVRVRLLFTGRETGESGRGSSGRAPGSRKPVSGELLARLYSKSLGLHAVSFDALFPARKRGFAASELRLEWQGQAKRFHLEPASDSFGPGSRLYFHADATAGSTDFSAETAWELLRSRDGVAMPLVAAAPRGGPVSSPSTGQASFETNRFYQPGLLDAPDLWLWQGLASGATRTQSFSLTGVAATASGTAELDIVLQGASESGNPVDHHVSASVNGVLVGEAQFAGKRPYRMSLSLPVSLLREGTNELSLTNVPDTGVASYVFLDRFTLSYPQTSLLAGGVFEGTWTEGGTAALLALTAPAALLDVTAAGAPGGGAVWLTGYEATRGSLRFRAEAGHRYLAVSEPALLTPRVAAPTPSSLRSTENQADYLLIAPRAFLASADPLLERRRDEGLQARAVSFEEVSDAFGHGQPSAAAIKSFLAFAFHSWTRPSPRYVLLLGDSSYDPRNFTGTSQPSPLPALWTKTSYLWTVSDPELAAVNGEDALPDLAIGRLPATTVEEAQKLVEKLLAWEDSGQGLAGRAALVADNPDLAGDFDADVDDIARSFLRGRDVRTLKLSELGAGTRASIRDALDSGLSFLSYVGHGGAAVWASENVWNSWDAPSLQAQSRQPLLLTLNCLNGYFVAPAFDSLAESLLKAEARGAIAAISPSGLSLDGPAHQYHRALMAELTGGRHETLGDAVLAAQKAYAQTGLMPELLAVYQLLGDPGTRLR